MFVFTTKKSIEVYLNSQKESQKSIGFVPTMGALHQGHLSLVKEAQLKNDVVIVSIFVNPTQFNNQKDLENYPITLEEDTAMLKAINCTALFIPTVSEMYETTLTASSFYFDGLENVMEGEFRSGHFNGVGTIIKRFFEMLMPTRAYFGEKDFQQVAIVKKLVEKLSMPIEIVCCPVFREHDGLAMSSRNRLLSKDQRAAAPFIHEVLQHTKQRFKTQNISEINCWIESQFKTHSHLKLEYFCIANPLNLQEITSKKASKNHRAFIAVFAGEIRLIDTLAF